MRYILFHADRIAYKTKKKALRNPPDPPGEYDAGPAVAVFVTVEAGDDDRVVRRAASDIVEYARDTVRESRIVLYPYAHLSNRLEKPVRAHRVLLKLEEAVRSSFQGEVHRAPFGWYKEFLLKVKGHPLSELSRSIEPGPPARLGPVTLESIDEAVALGLLPRDASPRPRLEGLAREKAELLGLDCTRTEALHYEARIIAAAERLAHARIREVRMLRAGESLWDIIRSYSEVAGSPVVGRHSCPLLTVVGLPAGTDIEEIVGAAGVAGGVEWSRGEEPRLLLYKPGDAPPVVLGASTGEGGVLGPVGNIVAAAIHYQAERVKRGETPVLPAWLHPVTAAVIPASSEALDYARTIAGELSLRGANVAILEPTIGLGARIRWAGKRWVPYVIVAGKREASTGTVTVRRRAETGKQETLPLPTLVEEVGRALQFYGGTGRVYSIDVRQG